MACCIRCRVVLYVERIEQHSEACQRRADLEAAELVYRAQAEAWAALSVASRPPIHSWGPGTNDVIARELAG